MNFNLFSGYVLAGGKSSRMGTDKAFLKFGDKTFLERAVNALENVCENRIKIVLNSNQTHFIEKLSSAIFYLFDIFEDRGALGGIHAALKDCRTEFAIILACDMPFVTSDAVEKLTQIAIDSKEFSAIIPRQTDGRLQPLCAVYRVEKCLPELEDYLSEKSSNAVKDFLDLIDAKFIEADLIGDNKKLLSNINRLSEYESLKN